MCLGGRIRGRCCEGADNGKTVVIPLIGASSTVRVLDFTAQVELKQRYENQNDFPIEAVYEFPLPDTAAITAFIIEIDGKTIKSQILPKEKAREKYDDAIASGHGAYLMEENKTSLFTTSIGNLPPGKEVLITTVYVQELEFSDEDQLQFVLPTTNFAPNGQAETAKFTQSKSSEYDKVVPYGVRVRATIETSSRLLAVTSPSHPSTVVESGYQGHNRAVVTIDQNDGSPLTSDWILQILLAQKHAVVSRVQQHADSLVAMVALHPEMDVESTLSEIIFVVDRSGSMGGKKMDSVQETLDIFLRSLPDGTLFNIVGFGSRFAKLFGQSVPYNKENFEKARKYVKNLDASFGGTEIMQPMQSIFNEQANKGVPRQVFLLTDGEVSNTNECIALCKSHAKYTRVFTFGIGHDCDKKLVMGMAKAANGSYEFSQGNTDMDEQVLRQLSRALKPAFVNLSLNWGTELTPVITQTPYHCPPLFNGGTIIFYGLAPKGTKGTHNVTLTAQTPKGPFTTTVPVNFDNVTEGDSIVKLAARSLIRDLQEDRSYMHDDHGKLLNKYTADTVTDAVVKVSLDYQVLSKHTSFIAVEKRKEATIATMKTIDLNNNNDNSLSASDSSGSDDDDDMDEDDDEDEGDDLSEDEFESNYAPQQQSMRVQEEVMREKESDKGMSYSVKQKKESIAPAKKMRQKKDSNSAVTTSAASPVKAKPMAVPDASADKNKADGNTVRAVLKQQEFTGAFSMATLKSIAKSVTADVVKKFGAEHKLSEAAVVTLFVTVVFELKFAAQKTVWVLVMNKSKQWIKKEFAVADLTGLETAAKTLLQPLL